jgi:hypothetical protein
MLRACSSVPPSGTARIIREHALGSLRKALGEVREIVGSEARARQVCGAGAFARAFVGASEK